jgi:Spy/CpxP family protein refolding chaperone
MKQQTDRLALILVLAGAVALAQQPPQPPQGQGQEAGPGAGYGPPGGPGRGGMIGRGTPPPPRPNRPPLERSLPPGTWWRNPDMVQKLALNSDQQKKIEDVFQQHRLKLVDLDATLQKEEITLEPLMAADSPDETKTLAQIDKVAQARAELEKANARFLFAIRRVLTPEQWKKLQETSRSEGGLGGGPPPPPPGRGGRGR